MATRKAMNIIDAITRNAKVAAKLALTRLIEPRKSSSSSRSGTIMVGALDKDRHRRR